MNAPLALLGLLAIPAGASVVLLQQQKAKPPHAAASRPAASSAQSTPGFRVAGLQVNSPVHTGAAPASDDAFGVELAFFGSFARTSVAVELARGAGGIIGIDDERCRLARFSDDRGTDLAKKDAFPGPFEMPRVSDDGRHLVFTVASETLPDPAATRLALGGVLALRVATEQETFVAEDVELVEGTRFTVGSFELEVTANGPSEWSDGHSLTLSSRRDLTTIVSWSLVLDDGTELSLRPSMSMSGMGRWEQTLQLEREVARADLRIACWKDLQTLEVPFELSAGLGLK
jgi:hypothetical protein